MNLALRQLELSAREPSEVHREIRRIVRSRWAASGTLALALGLGACSVTCAYSPGAGQDGTQPPAAAAPTPAAPQAAPAAQDAPSPAHAAQPVAPAASSAERGSRGQQLVDLEVPELRGHVNDYARLLTGPQVKALEDKLSAHEGATGQQFALLTWNDVGDVTAADFGFTVANRWGLGRKDADDGVLLFIAVKQRKIDLEVGRGLETQLPNALASTIVDELSAALRSERVAAGLSQAFDRLIAAAAPDKAPAAPNKTRAAAK